ncbi:LacI family DNA-binding transcriptional regulator [Vibrio sp.]|uniref:LacI family transcriptional regulator n=1 Tax=Vibrio viridaestus TaxID=2487322 RepID=A0A3N9TE30_9VIBR|nr:LacI family DNA-binding transcriptional regulator [Vibrio viridaestus]MDC0609192.1 LacI family DNA-binding transcriptional regulator [Vibrio sp.]RQW62349.1 LacI family transcriptional regulator [Vibrio viridaestus]
MRKKKVTMLDIATAVGVSQPTVSVILNGSDSIKISPETRDKVIRKAHELGYKFKTNVPHSSAHRRIALMINSMNMHDPFINALSAAKVKAWELDTVLTVFDFEDNDDLRTTMLEDINSGGFDGLIYALNTPSHIDEAIPTTLPMVFLNCTNDVYKQDVASITTSDFIGGYKATQHLIENGHKDIAMICGEDWAESSIQRVRGFRQAMTNADNIINDSWILEGNWSLKQAYHQALTLLEHHPRPSAIFCASDLMALGVYQAAAKLELSIPNQLSVMGYDNQLLANEVTPGLSTIDLPYDEMGRIAVEVLLSQQTSDLKLIKVEGELFIRESTQSYAE